MKYFESRTIGAIYDSINKTCYFRVWAPGKNSIHLLLTSSKHSVPMEHETGGYWSITLPNQTPGTEYEFVINNELKRPDPASRFQPDVHGPSIIVNNDSFDWEDYSFRPVPLQEMIIYELHVGTFSDDGTFYSLVTELDRLLELGINTIEIMPVSQFPGSRNWGYDGVYPFAVQNSYGGPDGLKFLVNEAHKRNISVILDVVYNHFGPEGNYFRDFGPYFTDTYKTPWGAAINFDGAGSDEVRNFFIQNALYWFEMFHIDGLRLDAVHAIFDRSAHPFLRELQKSVSLLEQKLRRPLLLIAESDLNDSSLVRPLEMGGTGLDAQWLDDYHHCVHTLLTSENEGYYADYSSLRHLEKSLNEGFVYSGQYSQFRDRSHGNTSRDLSAEKFIIFIQNHDQIGNRMLGERLSALVNFSALKLAAGLLFLSPGIPMLFMGEEYGETAPFLYFVDHSDPDLLHAVSEGRKREFSSFTWKGAPPEPSDESTFIKSKPDRSQRLTGNHKYIYQLYQDLIELRKTETSLKIFARENTVARSVLKSGILTLLRTSSNNILYIVFNTSNNIVNIIADIPEENFHLILDSSSFFYGGEGSKLPESLVTNTKFSINPLSFAVYRGNVL